MIDRRIPGQSRDELLSLFHSLYDMGWGCLMLCDSLKHFSYSEISFNSITFPNIYTEFEKAVLPLLCLLLRFRICNEYKLHMRRCCIKMKNRKLHFNTRRLYFIIFLYRKSEITETLFINVFKSNKQNYFQTKQILSHCIIDTKTFALSGWVLLGLHFYLNKRYNTAIHVLEFIKSLTSLGQFPVSMYSQISIRNMLSQTNREYGFLNIFQKIKLKTAKVIELLSKTKDQSFITDELLQRYPGNRDIRCPSGVLLYYLMFISYHRLNDISRRDDCLHDLMLYVTTESTKVSPMLHCFSLLYLRRAFEIVSDTDGVNDCNIVLLTLLITTDLKKYIDQAMNNC
jgi:hypothetical protein